MTSSASSPEGVGKSLSDLEWLRSFVQDHGQGQTAEELFPKLGSTESISGEALGALRKHLEQQVANAEQEICELENTAARVRHERQLWQDAGTDTLISALDTDAVQEGHGLALACARLSLTPEQACQQSARVDSIVELATEAYSVDVRLAERKSELLAAQHALRQSALQLAYAVDTSNTVRSDAERHKHEVISAKERADLMDVKAKQYEETVDDLQELVRNTGLTARTTHDAVVNDFKLLTDLEQQLEQINDALAEFHDLPPVSYREDTTRLHVLRSKTDVCYFDELDRSAKLTLYFSTLMDKTSNNVAYSTEH